ncbi:ribose transport system substrate-binding protein [Seinonella peptonophila]|uniref:Ribose transport system substrate-binding protein n=1 Tax=Seinonella peptonophila TaxID=112248 RepID=A0A1M4T411_9BACL|nr:sugar ABC transporter substrate-binding protein [Seinonella peptonophila]SHE39037.1 ribose transport system substrate-binding protein [Seinonella peptonophila]
MKRVRLLLGFMLTIALIVAGCAQSNDGSVTNKAVPNVKVPKGGHVEAVKKLPEQPLRIAFLSFQNNPFWFPVRDGALAAKKYLKNFNTEVDYIVMGDDLTSDKVVSAMETAITKQYDAIAVVPIFDGTEGVINKAVSSNIPVVTLVAEGSKPSKRMAFIGQDAKNAGKLAGQEIEKITSGKGKVGVITGVFGATQHEQRMNGALDYLKANVPGVQVVGKYENKDQAETAYTLTKNMLTAHPDLKAVYVTAGGPFGAAKAIKDMGLTGKVKVVCFDHIPENVKYVRSGEIAAAIAQDPFGQGFDSLVRLYNHVVTKQKPEKTFFPVKLDVLTPENVDQLFPK